MCLIILVLFLLMDNPLLFLLSQMSFALNPAALADAWEPGCKVLMLNFPTNPTGGTASPEVLRQIAKFACEKDLIVLSDEIYSELTFDGTHQHRHFPWNEGADNFFTRLFQSLFHDGIPHRLCLRSGGSHRGDDEGSPIQHDVCLHLKSRCCH